MPKKTVSAKATVAVRADGSFRFAVVADTHGKPHPASADRVRELEPDAILHAGDIGELEVLDLFREIAPVFAVRGNIDTQTRQVPDVITLEVMDGERMKLRLLLVHIAVYGPKLRAEVAQRARSERASLVVCGHSHVPFIGRDRGITLFNPGSIGPRRFQLPILLGAIELTRESARLKHIDCESGQPWLPP